MTDKQGLRTCVLVVGRFGLEGNMLLYTARFNLSIHGDADRDLACRYIDLPK